MKQYQSLRGAGIMEVATEYIMWGGAELFQATLGFIWFGILMCFVMFFYTYRSYYHKGVILKDKSYYLTYLDLQKVVRKIAVACCFFVIGSYFITFAPGFTETLMKGAVMSVIVYPPVYRHYNDETQYRFEFTKGD